MENSTLLTLLEEDREMIMGMLRADRSPQAAQSTLEKSIDRIALRYAEQSSDPAEGDAAQLILKSLRSALPLVDSVGEARRWERTTGEASKKGVWKPATLGFLAVGVVLILSVLLGLVMVNRKLTGLLTLFEAAIPAALGMAALFYAGLRHGRPEKPSKMEAPAAREEFLIDPEKVWHHLRGAILMADNALEGVRSQELRHREIPAADTTGTKLDARLAELFSNLLETAYARNDADDREMIEGIAFYLHGAGIEVVNYESGREACFEFLPAPTPGTLRPALMNGDRIVKKGLAAK